MIYLASPYTHQDRLIVDERVRKTEKATVNLMHKTGKAVFSPIVYGVRILKINQEQGLLDLPGDFEFWRSFCINTLKACDSFTVLTIEGWSKSVGVQEELALARKLQKEIHFYDA